MLREEEMNDAHLEEVASGPCGADLQVCPDQGWMGCHHDVRVRSPCDPLRACWPHQEPHLGCPYQSRMSFIGLGR